MTGLEAAETIRRLCPVMKPLSAAREPRLIPLREIRAILFDIYGTLFISGSGDIGTSSGTARAEAFSQALEALKLSPTARAGQRGSVLLVERIEDFHAMRKRQGIEYPEIEIRQILSSVLDTLRLESEIKGAAVPDSAARLALEYECRINPTWPMPGLSSVLTTLSAQRVLGIVSNAQFFTPFLFTAFLEKNYGELGFYKPACVWSYRLLEAKPSQTLFAGALSALETDGINAAQVLYVGNDMGNDILPAAEIGFRTALFAGDRRSLRLRRDDPRCRAVQPDLEITDLSQLGEILI